MCVGTRSDPSKETHISIVLVFLYDLLDGDNEEGYKMIKIMMTNLGMLITKMMMMMTNLSRHIWVRPRHGHTWPLGCTTRPNTVALRMIKIVNSFVIDAI